MRLQLILTGLAVLAATRLPTAAAAGQDGGRGTFLSVPPDLTTRYLQGHYPHRDPLHPNARYRHRKLGTADERGVDRFNGEVEVFPAGTRCDFAVKAQQWGHLSVLGVVQQLLYEKYFHDKTSVWDGTIDDQDRKLCQFLS